jgi:hypothetical protein
MKKTLLLSLLVLFSCSKDDTPGDEIIGVHQLIGTSFVETGERGLILNVIENPGPNGEISGCRTYSFFSNGTLEFRDNKKGLLSLTGDFMAGWGESGNVTTDIFWSENHTRTSNFDWTYENGRWNILDENNNTGQVMFFNDVFKLHNSWWCGDLFFK